MGQENERLKLKLVDCMSECESFRQEAERWEGQCGEERASGASGAEADREKCVRELNGLRQELRIAVKIAQEEKASIKKLNAALDNQLEERRLLREEMSQAEKRNDDVSK